MYKGYECRHYDSDGRYQTFKARPYDDAEYYWGYSFDKFDWLVAYRGRAVCRIQGNFETVVDFIEEKNKGIKPKIMNW